MKKNILFVSMCIGITGLFLYKTIESNSNTRDFPIDIIGYNPDEPVVKPVEQDSIEDQNDSQEGTENRVKAAEEIVVERSITDILPNANELSRNELIDEAEILLTSRDPQKNSDGLLILNNLAADNNARANYILAELYENGVRVQEDNDKALELYKIAALNGSDDANIFMFNYYLDNELTTQEHYDEALAWFTEALQNNRNAIAQYGIAYMYEIGLGIEADQTKAIEYYKKSVQNNFVLSYERLADLYLLTSDAKNIEEALLLFQRAANADIPTAQFKLGYMYEAGLGTRQDYETARFWYQKAVTHDLSVAQVALGNLYAGAFGVEQDNVKAYQYYRSAAEKHNVVAQIAVARSFERGLGIDKDLDRAMFWYSKAVEQNDATAQYNLGRILEEYEEIYNLDEAKKWYEKAAESGIVEATTALERLSKQ